MRRRRGACAVAAELVDAEQVYTCLWSHAGARPGHIHWMVQPVTAAQVAAIGLHGPALEMAMFEADVRPDPREVERVATVARERFVAAT